MGRRVGAASSGVLQPLSGPSSRSVSSFPRYIGTGPVLSLQVTECSPAGAPGVRWCGLKEQEPPPPPNLRGDRPAQRKDSYPSSDTGTAVRAPDSWRPKSLPRPRLC